MNKTVLIFGGTGQDGFFLKKILVNLKYSVKIYSSNNQIKSHQINISNYAKVKKVIKIYQPEIIFHFAAKSSTEHKFIIKNHNAIVIGALNILESVYKYSPKSKVFIASSGLVFKNDNKPISELSLLDSSSAYAVARIEALYLARYYRTKGLKVYVGFLFNHESPLRIEESVVREVTKGAIDVYYGLKKNINIRNPNIIKEWMWAGDAMNAIMVFIKQEKEFEICIGDGIGKSISDYAHTCFKLLNITNRSKILINQHYDLNSSRFISNPQKIKSLGWKPNNNFLFLAKQMIKAEFANRKKKVPNILRNKIN